MVPCVTIYIFLISFKKGISEMKKLFISSIIAVAIAISFANVNVFAQSSKGAIGNTNLMIVPDSSTVTTTSSDVTDTGWFEIMTANIKTANDKGFAFDVALQTAITTDTTVKSKGGNKDSSSASGRVLVRVQVTDPDGNVGYAQPSADLDARANSGVTYDYRLQLLEAKFQGICIDEVIDPETGEVSLVLRGSFDECDYEEVRLMLDTLQANAFNFYYGLTDSGVYHVEVQAKLVTETSSGTGLASAKALVGLGSMFVESVRLVKGSGWEAPTIDLK